MSTFKKCWFRPKNHRFDHKRENVWCPNSLKTDASPSNIKNFQIYAFRRYRADRLPSPLCRGFTLVWSLIIFGQNPRRDDRKSHFQILEPRSVGKIMFSSRNLKKSLCYVFLNGLGKLFRGSKFCAFCRPGLRTFSRFGSKVWFFTLWKYVAHSY